MKARSRVSEYNALSSTGYAMRHARTLGSLLFVIAFTSENAAFAQNTSTVDAPQKSTSATTGKQSNAASLSMSASKQQLDEISVTAVTNKLNQEAVSGSRLGLTPLETPASVEVIGAQTMEARGFSQVQDAIDSLPGVTSGGSPADPTGFSMRGFTSDQITMLRNGAYVGPSNMVNRPQNSFNLADVEVLKGPASVIYGQGAVGGIVNVITKEPEFGPTRFDSFASFGRYGTTNIGIGGSTQLSSDSAIRVDISRTSSDGYIKNDNPDSLNLTATGIWNIRDNLSLKVILDYMNDDLPSYYGTPLVPASFATDPLTGVLSSSKGLTVDKRTADKNYNVADGLHEGKYVWPTAILTWQPTDAITISNEAYVFYATRKWANAETYTFLGANNGQVDANGNPIPANVFARDRFHVYHTQHDYSDLLDAKFDYDFLGMKNRTTVGLDFLDIRFRRTSGFPDAQYVDYVDPFNPNQGQYGDYPGDDTQRYSPTYIRNTALLFEDALDISSALKLVTGFRYENLRVDRQYYNTDGSFNATRSFIRSFDPFSYRIGAVYEIAPQFMLYGQWTTATDPPGANIFITSASNLQSLTHSRQGEVGAKGVFFDGRINFTLAVYDIDRRNILVATSNNSVANAGSERSRGVEWSSDFKIDDHLKISANAAYTHARYGVFVDPNSGIDASGNKVPDVPGWTANVWAQYSRVLDTPVDAGLGLRYISSRAGDFANTLTLDSYTLVNTYLTYHVNANVSVTGRINNLFNKSYISWTDVNYPTEVILGRPRFYSLEVATHF